MSPRSAGLSRVFQDVLTAGSVHGPKYQASAANDFIRPIEFRAAVRAAGTTGTPGVCPECAAPVARCWGPRPT
eukprot:3930206-Pleurochrysis_carterae.AAC.1